MNNMNNKEPEYKSQDIFRVLFIGDIVGKPGRRAVLHFVPLLKAEENIDLVIANGENMSAGKGITYEKYKEVMDGGVDFMTSGNHIWNNKEFFPYLDREEVKVIRPANYPSTLPGRGSVILDVKGVKISIINVQGRVFMRDDIEDPFVVCKNIVDQNKDSINIIDFHAEATSEKIALGYYLDGLVAAVLGTHTHVQTADEKVLSGGTAFISDAGMCGPKESVLGVEKEIIIEKFLTAMPLSHKVAKGDSQFNAVIVDINKVTKKALSIRRVSSILKV